MMLEAYKIELEGKESNQKRRRGREKSPPLSFSYRNVRFACRRDEELY
jgi:hypothetical protein